MRWLQMSNKREIRTKKPNFELLTISVKTCFWIYRMLGNSSYSCSAGLPRNCQCLCNESQFVRDDRSYGQPNCHTAHQSNDSRYLSGKWWRRPCWNRQGKKKEAPRMSNVITESFRDLSLSQLSPYLRPWAFHFEMMDWKLLVVELFILFYRPPFES